MIREQFLIQQVYYTSLSSYLLNYYQPLSQYIVECYRIEWQLMQAMH